MWNAACFSDFDNFLFKFLSERKEWVIMKGRFEDKRALSLYVGKQG